MADDRCPHCGSPNSEDASRCSNCGLQIRDEDREDQRGDEALQTTIGCTQDLPVARPGSSIGGYRVIRKLGHGGMGVVWEAEQQMPRRPVALKVIRGGQLVDEHHVKLFEREAQTLARLKHPGIAAIHEAGCTADGEHFFAMELVRGESLGDYVAHRRGESDRPFDTSEILSLFLQIADAVSYAHQRAVIHRDLKPSNILVSREKSSRESSGSGPVPPRIKIVDFGLARITEADVAATTALSEAGTVRGTLQYMSPEQTRGNPDEIDLRSDVYSMGVILYEMLTGAPPYQLPATGVVEAVRIIREDRPRQPCRAWAENRSTLNTATRTLDRDLETIVLKALEKEPSRRYQSVSDMAGDIERHLAGHPIMARPPSAGYQLRKLVARHRTGAGFLVALLLLLSGFLVVTALQSGRIARQRDRAVEAEAQARTEAETARQVTEFLTGLFEVADPGEARGSTITASEILDRGAGRIEAELGDSPLVQARMMRTVGSVYQSLGLFDRAETLLRAALDTRMQLLGDDHLEVAQSLNDLAYLYQRLGRKDEGEHLCVRALEIRENALGSDHPDVAQSLHTLANILSNQGQLAEAEALYRRALEIRERALGSDHEGVAATLSMLASVLEDQGKLEEAEPLFLRAVEICESTLPPGHYGLAMPLTNLAAFYQVLGRFDEAELLFENALRISETALGRDHPLIAAILVNLGYLHVNRGDYAEAEPLYTRALEIQEETLGPDHEAVAATLINLGHLYLNQNRYPEAENSLRRAITIEESTKDLDERVLAGALVNLGGIYHRQERHAEEAPLLKRALNIYDRESEYSAPARFLAGLGGMSRDHGRNAEAERLFQAALETTEETLGPDHETAAPYLVQLGALYLSLGRLDEAEPMFGRALRIYETAEDVQSLQVAWVLHQLGSVYGHQRRLAEAEVVFRRIDSIYRDELGPDHVNVGANLQNLGSVLLAQGKDREGMEVFEQCLVIQEKTHGSDHPYVANILSGMARVSLKASRYDEARKLCERGIGILEPLVVQQPSDARLANALSWEYIQLGRARQGLGQATKAHEAWVRSLKLIGSIAKESIGDDSPDTGILDTYSQALLLLGRVEEARPVVEMLVRQGWDDEVFLDLCREHGLVLDSPAPNGPGV